MCYRDSSTTGPANGLAESLTATCTYRARLRCFAEAGRTCSCSSETCSVISKICCCRRAGACLGLRVLYRNSETGPSAPIIASPIAQNREPEPKSCHRSSGTPVAVTPAIESKLSADLNQAHSIDSIRLMVVRTERSYSASKLLVSMNRL
jgi:hypothetical protein